MLAMEDDGIEGVWEGLGSRCHCLSTRSIFDYILRLGVHLLGKDSISQEYPFALMAAGIESLPGRVFLAYQEEACSLLSAIINHTPLFLKTC